MALFFLKHLWTGGQSPLVYTIKTMDMAIVHQSTIQRCGRRRQKVWWQSKTIMTSHSHTPAHIQGTSSLIPHMTREVGNIFAHFVGGLVWCIGQVYQVWRITNQLGMRGGAAGLGSSLVVTKWTEETSRVYREQRPLLLQ